ncbi:hypothetical protein ABHN11_24425 [Brevibacillus centrosporus]|uniref:hypothetical protein n=1 Tax=Brevibacillus centrosporus TaxID=54910 RepID=UPI003D22D9D9
MSDESLKTNIRFLIGKTLGVSLWQRRQGITDIADFLYEILTSETLPENGIDREVHSRLRDLMNSDFNRYQRMRYCLKKSNNDNFNSMPIGDFIVYVLGGLNK